MQASTESTPLARGAIRVAALFVAAGVWMMVTRAVTAKVPGLGNGFAIAPPPFTYTAHESWVLLGIVAALPAMLVAGDLAGAALARGLGGRVLTFAASTDLLIGLGAVTLTLAPAFLGATYGLPATPAFRGLFALLMCAHVAHARRTASKVIWALVALVFVLVPLQVPAIYPAPMAGVYLLLAGAAMAGDAWATGKGHVPAEHAWLSLLPLGVATGVLVLVVFTMLDTGMILGIDMVPFLQVWSAGDVPAMERATQHILTVRPEQPVAMVFLADVRLKQGRWSEVAPLAAPFAGDGWQGGEVGRMARNVLANLEGLRALERKHGPASLALAKAAEAGAFRAQNRPELATENRVIAVPLYERAAANDHAAQVELDRVRAQIASEIAQVKAREPKPAASPAPSASPARHG